MTVMTDVVRRQARGSGPSTTRVVQKVGERTGFGQMHPLTVTMAVAMTVASSNPQTDTIEGIAARAFSNVKAREIYRGDFQNLHKILSYVGTLKICIYYVN